MAEIRSSFGQQVDLSTFLVHKEGVPGVQTLDAVCVEDRPRHNPVFGPAKPGGLTAEALALTMGYNAQHPGGILRVGRSFNDWISLVDNLLNTEKHESCAAREKAPAIVGTIATKPTAVLTGMRQLGEVDEKAYDRIVESAQELTENGFITVTDIPKEEQTQLRAWVTGSIPHHAARYMVAIQNSNHYWNTQAAWEAGAPAYAANVGMYDSHANRLNGALSLANYTGIQVDEGLYVTASLAFVAATRENLPHNPQIVQI